MNMRKVSRKGFLQVAATAAGGALLASCVALPVTTPAPARGTPAPGADIVLVHGAWAGGWAWKRVAPLLRAQGHNVFTPTLSSLPP